MARKPPPLHSKIGPLSEDALYDEVPCRKVPLTLEDEAWQKQFIEDGKAPPIPPVKKPA